jgi:hypothetical protein
MFNAERFKGERFIEISRCTLKSKRKGAVVVCSSEERGTAAAPAHAPACHTFSYRSLKFVFGKGCCQQKGCRKHRQ